MLTKPIVKELRFPCRLFDATLDKETDYDGNLPEFCPDIVRIIRVDCTPYADGCTVDGERAVVSGRILYDILYEADRKRKLRYCSFVEDFTHTVELPKSDILARNCECKAICSKITVKMLSPRHLILHARLELSVTVTGEKVLPMIAVEEQSGIFFKKKQFTYDAFPETAKSEHKFDETLSLLQGEKNVGEIIFGSVTLQPPQVNLQPGSATAKTNAVVKVLYAPEDSEDSYCMSVKTVPVSVTVESPEIGEENHTTLSLTLAAQDVSADLDQYGENRILKAGFTVEARAVSVAKQTMEAAEDLFTADGIEETKQAQIVVPELEETLDRSFTVDLKIAPDEPPFSTVYDSTVRTTRVRAGIAEGGVEIEGVLILSVLGEGSDGIQHRDYVENFDQFIPADLPRHASGVMVEITPFEVLPTLHSDGSISARVICNARIFIYTEEKVTFLSGIESQTELPPEDDPCTVAYFFPDHGETLWSVAKRYHSDPAAVEADNPGVFGEDGSLAAGARAVLVKRGEIVK